MASVMLALAFMTVLIGQLGRTYGRDLRMLEHDGTAAHPTASVEVSEDRRIAQTLSRENIPFPDERTAVATARALCVWFDQTGESFEHGVEQLAKETPAWSMDQTKRFGYVATENFCPAVAR